MNVNQKVQFLLFLLIVTLSFNACGYKPSVTYAKKELLGNVFVNLFVDLQDPRNAVIIKDSVNELLIQKLGSKLVFDKKNAQTILNLRIDSVSMTTLQYDKDGHNKLYKAIVSILVGYENQDKKKAFNILGEENFSVDDGSVISDAKRFEAIKSASSNALDELISKIAVYSYK